METEAPTPTDGPTLGRVQVVKPRPLSPVCGCKVFVVENNIEKAFDSLKDRWGGEGRGGGGEGQRLEDKYHYNKSIIKQ